MGYFPLQGPGKGVQRSAGACSGAGHASKGGSGSFASAVAIGGPAYDNVSLPVLVGSGGGGPSGGQGAGFITISASQFVLTGLIQADGMPGLTGQTGSGGGGGGSGGTIVVAADLLVGSGSISVMGGAGGHPGGGGGSGGIVYANLGSVVASPFLVSTTGGVGVAPGVSGGTGLAWAVVSAGSRARLGVTLFCSHDTLFPPACRSQHAGPDTSRRSARHAESGTSKAAQGIHFVLRALPDPLRGLLEAKCAHSAWEIRLLRTLARCLARLVGSVRVPRGCPCDAVFATAAALQAITRTRGTRHARSAMVVTSRTCVAESASYVRPAPSSLNVSARAAV